MSPAIAWALLVVAGLFEIAWAIGLKYTAGFTRPLPTVMTVAAMVISMGLLGITARQLPIGTAYAVWTGIGAACAAIIGMAMYGESAEPSRIACIILIVAGTAGLRLVSST